MIFRYTFLLLFVFLVCGCTDKDAHRFEEEIKRSAVDRKIDKGEYEKLIRLIKQSNSDQLKGFINKNKVIDTSRLVRHVLTIANNSDLSLTKDNIWHPLAPVNKLTFDVDVYIENSASMDGYVKGVTEFEQSVYSLISDIKISDFADSLNLFYLNSQIISWRKDAQNQEISDFIEKLEPTTFQQRGGIRTKSDLQKGLKMVLNEINKDNIAVFVSDCIFSPGPGEDAQNFLVNQQIGLKTIFDEKLDSFDFSTIIIKFSSKFSGEYYNQENHPFKLSEVQRPYYILLMGSLANIDLFLERINLQDYRTKGLLEIYQLSKPRGMNSESKITRMNKVGEFDIVQPATKLIINNAKSAKQGSEAANLFQFSIAANLSKLNMQDSYIEDPGNYEIPGNYKITSIKRNIDKTNEALAGYSHLFTLATTELIHNQDIYLRLKSKVPGWVDESTVLDDHNIDDVSKSNKTFGLKYLVHGISEAYGNKYKHDAFFSINAKVRTSGGDDNGAEGGGFPWMLIVVVLIVGAIIIALKNKR